MEWVMLKWVGGSYRELLVGVRVTIVLCHHLRKVRVLIVRIRVPTYNNLIENV